MNTTFVNRADHYSVPIVLSTLRIYGLPITADGVHATIRDPQDL